MHGSKGLLLCLGVVALLSGQDKPHLTTAGLAGGRKPSAFSANSISSLRKVRLRRSPSWQSTRASATPMPLLIGWKRPTGS